MGWKDGGLGVRASMFWKLSEFILTQGIYKRYVKEMPLIGVQVKPLIDSVVWKSFLAAREDIGKCMDCMENY